MPLDNANVDETTRLLIEARGFIERGWCKGAQARDREGNLADPKSNEAVAWCLYGALVAAGVPYGYQIDHLAVRRVNSVVDFDIAGFNNVQVDRAPILAVLDAAIGSN